MTTIYPAPEAVAGVLDGAADHIERVGLHKGGLFDPDSPHPDPADCPACLIGAINAVIYGTPGWVMFQGAKFDLRDAVCTALRETIEIPPTASPDALADWNDDPAVTGENVKAALRATAARLRGDES